MADVKWIKIVPDVFDDDKIKLIENMPEGDSIIVIWFKLLCLAGKQNRDGFLLLNDKIAYTDEMLSTVFRRPLNIVKLALNVFEQFDMIEIINGAVYVANWEKHQNVDKMAELREYNKLAQRKSRAKKKLLPPASDVNDKSMTSQECQDTDIEKEKEKDQEQRKKKESSYEEILSRVADDDLRDLYLEYIKMRKMIKSPMTDRALTMLINKVNELEPNSLENQKKLLETAIMNNWKSVYPLRDTGSQKQDKQPSKQEEELLKMFGGQAGG